MKTPCEFWAEEVMPNLRADIARILYSRGLTQAKIAEYLGITQAMVSKYLTGKYKRLGGDLSKEIQIVAQEVAGLILYGAKKEDIIRFLNKKFFEMLRSGILCRGYLEYIESDDESLCSDFFSGEASRTQILEELNLALGGLLRDKGFLQLIPEIRSNFAYSLPDPKEKDDIAAVPGRITHVKDKAYALPPEFGASEHMAGVLIALSNVFPDVRSVLNIKYDENIFRALKNAGFKFGVIEKSERSEDETVRLIVEEFKKKGPLDAVVDRGGFGIEPCVYIFGKNPIEVVEKVKKLESFL
ncbi:phosphomethylpyrimidine kinase [Thermococci archaeon]|nr:MAG: phosphomethylpyrimidine kinase [Archaeoglobales archaeon ex4484_92]RLF75009.1 MAG: phosphomethylpyrimidine kinase [Thermococci archaeon]HDO71363.1 helix-turn-helix domain-containing protein [bacterium]RLF81226.1 MAG: phosphomethylpyrimidine kinase [Thermococci archaeon]RLF84219.1 MAG: phosphomethylpyrimidine kinase [Thermococci archaeon]